MRNGESLAVTEDRAMSAAMWGGFGSLGRVGIQLLTQVVLARLLGPAEYGVFAVGALVVVLTQYLADAGFAYGLVKRDPLEPAHIRFVWTWQLVMAGTVALAIFTFAPAVAEFVGKDRVREPIRALSLVVLLLSITAPAINLLKRDLQFKVIQLTHLATYILGYVCCAIPLAANGAGVWALVTGWIVQAMLSFVLLYARVRHPVRPLFWHTDAQWFFRFGGIVLLTNVTNWLVGNLDKVLVARTRPTCDIGLYNTAFNLANTPASAVYASLQSVTFAVAARVHDDRAALRRTYRTAVGTVLIFFLPAASAASAAANEIVLALYGKEWRDAAPVLAAFVFTAPLLLVWGLSTPMLWNTNQASREVKTQLPYALIVALALFAISERGLPLIAWVVVMINFARTGYIVNLVRVTLTVSVRDLLLTLAAPFCYSLITVCAVHIGRHLVASWDVGVWISLSVEVFLAALGWLVSVRVLGGLIDPFTRLGLKRLGRRLPAPLAAAAQKVVIGGAP